jgi:dihydroorotate dehydrogenase subfamily 1
MIEFAGYTFKNPFVVASSPLTVKPELLKKAEEFGAAAVSTKLTFLKQPFYGTLRMYHNLQEGSIVCHDRRLDMQEGVALIEKGRRITRDLIIFANMTHAGSDLEGWAELGRALENAGAHILEPNLICPNLGLTARALGEGAPAGGAIPGQSAKMAFDIVTTLKGTVRIPVVPKLTPNVTDVTVIARACEEAGADGICLAGAQLSLPPVDIYHPDSAYPLLRGASMGSLGGPACRLMGFAQVASVARRVKVPIVGGGGLETWEHAVQYMMWGATLVTACTALMWYGFEVIPKVLDGMETFMAEQGYTRYADMTGLAAPLLRAAEALEVVPGVAIVDQEACIGCGRCVRPGHCEAVTMAETNMPGEKNAVIDPQACLGCGVCAECCPAGAITMQPTDQVSRKGNDGE